MNVNRESKLKEVEKTLKREIGSDKPQKRNAPVATKRDNSALEGGTCAGKGLKSTLCFDEGSPLVEIKLLIVRLGIDLVLLPNVRDALIGHCGSVQA